MRPGNSFDVSWNRVTEPPYFNLFVPFDGVGNRRAWSTLTLDCV
jgi:hypothetical protein